MPWQQTTTTHTTTTTTTVSDDDGLTPSPTAHTNPLQLTKEKSKRAYNALLARSAPLGKVLMSGREVGKPAPATCTLRKPELTYNKPDGCIVVSRSLIPPQMTEDALNKAAIRELPGNCDDGEVSDMVELIKDIRERFGEVLKSKHDAALTEAIRNACIPFNEKNRHCENNAEVFKALQSQPPTLEFMEKLYGVFYVFIEATGYREKLVYDTMLELKLWHSNDATSGLNTTQTKHGTKTSCFHALAVDTTRYSRSKYSKTKRIKHGVTLSISAKGGRKLAKMPRRNRTKGFLPDEYVRGWAEEKHIEFNMSHGFDHPVSFEEAVANYYSSHASQQSFYGPCIGSSKVCPVLTVSASLRTVTKLSKLFPRLVTAGTT